MYSAFYYQEKSDEILCSSKPSGTLDINKLLQGAPCWRNINAQEPKKKTLLICSWSAENWSKEECAEIQNVLYNLIQEGFSLYVWFKDGIELLGLNNASAIIKQNVNGEMSPAHYHHMKDCLIQKLAQQKLSPSKIHIIDDYWLDCLVKKVPESNLPLERAIRAKDFEDILYDDSFSSVLEAIFVTLNPPIKKIIINNMDETHIRAKEKLQHLLPKAAIVKEAMTLRLEFEDAQSLIQNGYISLLGLDITIQDLQSVKSFTLNFDERNTDGRILSQFIELMPNLNILTLYCEKTIFDQPVGLGNLQQLQSLHLGGKIDVNSFYQLHIGNKIKQLDIHSCIISGTSAPSFYFNELAEFISDSNETDIDLAVQLISNTSRLKVLDISASHDDDVYLPSASINLQLRNLHSLKINNLTSPHWIFERLLDQAPNLLHLSASNFNLNDTDGLIINLPYLEELFLDSSIIRINDLNQLLSASKHIHTLDINNAEFVDNDKSFFHIKHNMLCSYFNLENVHLNLDNIMILLNKMPALTALVIDECTNLTKVDIRKMPYPVNLEKLSTLTIHNTNLCLTDLFYLLSQTPNLQEFDLRVCALDIEEISIPESLTLDRLEEIKFDGVNIDADNLLFLLSATSALKKVQLISINNVSNNFSDLLALKLKDLSDLSIETSNMSFPNLIYLLNQAKGLTTLELIECLSLYDSDNQAFDSNPPIGLTKLSPLMNLNKLKVKQCSFAQLKVLLECSPNIHDLEVDSIDGTIDINELLPYKNLRSLKLRNCILTEASVRRFDKQYLTNIDTNLTDCSFLDDRNVKISSDQLKASLNKDSTIRIDSSYSGCYTQKSKQYYISNQLRPSKTTELLDANTSFQETTYRIKPLFYSLKDHENDPQPDYYRKQIVYEIELNKDICSINSAFTIFNRVPIDSQLEDRIFEKMEGGLFDFGKSLVDEEASTSYFGQFSITLSSQWQAIPSLSLNDEITYFSIKPDIDFEVKFCAEDKQYWIRGDALKVEIELIVKVHHIPQEQERIQNQLIADIVNKYKSFRVGDLIIHSKNPRGQDFLEYIQTQEKGACRHRSFACKAELDALQIPKLSVRIVMSDIHAFIEIKESDHWVRCDLGGYQAQVEIDKTAHPARKTSLFTAKPSIQTQQPAPLRQNPFTQSLETWEKNTRTYSDLSEFFQSLLKPGFYQKHLIEYDSTQAVDSMILVLETYLNKLNYPFFYISSAEQLICSAAFVESHNNRGQIKAGPGGPMYNFLSRERAKLPRVLIINYENFSADDIVGFNNLFAKEPSCDGTTVPSDLILIGILNSNNPDCYKGSDFYSRFEHKPYNSPIPLSMLDDFIYDQLQKQNHDYSNESTSIVFDCFNLPNWKERILGRWDIQGENLTYMVGELTQKLHGQKSVRITFKNAPWDNPQFNFFCKQAMLLGYIDNYDNGSRIMLPANFTLIAEQDEQHNKNTPILGFAPRALTLNPATFNDFFVQYEVDQFSHALYTQPGLIEAHKKQELTVNISRELSQNEWAYFLSTCQEHQVQLRAYLLPEIPWTIDPEQQTNKTLPESHTLVYYSKDVDLDILMLTRGQSDYLIIDISECDIHDLFTHIHGGMHQQQLTLHFEKQEKVLFKALKNQQKVILKGAFSTSLADSLAPILLGRMSDAHAKGQLCIFTDNAKLFHYLPRRVNSGMRQWQFLKASFNEYHLHAYDVKPDCFSRMHARIQYQKCFPENVDSEKAWEGIVDLPLNVAITDFDEENSAYKAWQFQENRIQAVENILAHQPFIALTGLSGTGKTTFVLHHFKDRGRKLFVGEDSMRDWALSDANQPILFIDEANISRRLWTEFEGLFNPQPSILIQGQWYPLKNHKVIFAFNPLNCGGDRRLSPFFLAHGNAFVFKPLSLEFIFEHALKPLFPNAKEAAALCRPILNIYRTICAWSTSEILISPRELQMIALLTIANPGVAVAHFAYQITRHLVPEKHLATFDALYKPNAQRPRTLACLPSQNFLITESRIRILQQLQDFLNLRQLRQERLAHLDNEALSYGGLGGIVFEGKPGIGKTELVEECLKSRGMVKGLDYDVLAVRTPNDEKTALLLKAFHAGKIVVIDEINSSSMQERLLNNLLMGKTPQGERPQKPGFMIIGTQNPCTMDGRKAASTALARRLLTIRVPEYTKEEMLSILQAKGVQSDTAKVMVEAYEQNVLKAGKEHLKPAPTFRNLCTLAENVIHDRSAPTLFAQNKRKHIDEENSEEVNKRFKANPGIPS